MLDVDFLMLADFAEVIGTKLYLQGGGWERLTVGKFPVQRNIGLAAGIVVPWSETNRQYRFSLEVVGEDGQKELVRVEADMETGRPPGIPPGNDQLVQVAFNGVLTFEEPGAFMIVAKLDGEVRRKRSFRVTAGPAGKQRP